MTVRKAVDPAPVYLGCYLDKGTVGTLAGRDLDGYLLSDTAGMTNEKCAATCGGRNFAFAGTESGKQCFCGNDYGSFGSSKACTAACSGNIAAFGHVDPGVARSAAAPIGAADVAEARILQRLNEPLQLFTVSGAVIHNYGLELPECLTEDRLQCGADGPGAVVDRDNDREVGSP